jgi:hypothetical protein
LHRARHAVGRKIDRIDAGPEAPAQLVVQQIDAAVDDGNDEGRVAGLDAERFGRADHLVCPPRIDCETLAHSYLVAHRRTIERSHAQVLRRGVLDKREIAERRDEIHQARVRIDVDAKRACETRLVFDIIPTLRSVTDLRGWKRRRDAQRGRVTADDAVQRSAVHA